MGAPWFDKLTMSGVSNPNTMTGISNAYTIRGIGHVNTISGMSDSVFCNQEGWRAA